MTIRPGRVGAAGAALTLTMTMAACGGTARSTGGGSGDDIVLGASLSMTGALGPSGADLSAGYSQAVSEINAAGGLRVGGGKRHVKLVVRDNRTDPTTASQQARNLIDNDGAVALLGACTPPLVLPQALAAEQRGVPYVTSCNPIQAFRAGAKTGWRYAWDVFFDETAQATVVANGLAKAKTNKRVALFTDTEPDGVAERPLYRASVTKAGLDLVGDYTFPVGTTDFSSFINAAKANGAQLVVGQMTPPDGLAFWKQMKALNFKPTLAFVSKAAASAEWPHSLGRLGNGTVTDGLWDVALNSAESTRILKGPLGKRFANSFADLSIAVLGYTVVQITADAITRAGSTAPAALNTAIGETNGDYALGKISFTAGHTYASKYVLLQWQNGTVRQVVPSAGGARLQIPTEGLR